MTLFVTLISYLFDFACVDVSLVRGLCWLVAGFHSGHQYQRTNIVGHEHCFVPYRYEYNEMISL